MNSPIRIIFYPLVVLLIIAAIPVFGVSASSSDDQDNTALMYFKAGQYEQEGNLDEALKLYQRILKLEPSPHIYMKTASLYYAKANKEMEKKTLEQGVKSFPDNAEIYYSLGLAIDGDSVDYEKNDPAKALETINLALGYYKKAAQLEHIGKYLFAVAYTNARLKRYDESLATYNELIDKLNNTIYYYSRGLVKTEMGDKKGAIKDFEKSVELNGDPQSLMILADIALSDNDTAKANEYLNQLSQKYPNMPSPDLVIAENFKETGEYNKAILFYLRATEKLTGDAKVDVLKVVGVLAGQINDYPVALKAFEDAIKINDNDSQLYYYAAVTADIMNDNKKAESLYKEGIAKFSDFTQLKKNYAVLLAKDKRYKDAEKLLLSIDNVERDVDFYLLLAEIYKESQESDKELAMLLEGLKENPANENIMLSLAVVYEKTGKRTEGIKILEKAIVFHPDNPIVLNFLGYIYADENINLDKALTMINRALEQEPDNAAYIDSKAWVLYRKGMYKEAYEWQKKAIEMLPDDEDIKSHMKQIKLKLDIK